MAKKLLVVVCWPPLNARPWFHFYAWKSEPQTQNKDFLSLQSVSRTFFGIWKEMRCDGQSPLTISVHDFRATQRRMPTSFFLNCKLFSPTNYAPLCFPVQNFEEASSNTFLKPQRLLCKCSHGFLFHSYIETRTIFLHRLTHLYTFLE